MHILFVTSYYKPAWVYGGPVQSTAVMCEEMTRQGTQVTVFTTNANGHNRLAIPLQQPQDVEGVQVHYFGLAMDGLSFFYTPTMANEIHSRVADFDLVVVESLYGYPMWPVAAASVRTGVPYVVTAHGQLLTWALSQKKLKKDLYMRLFGRRFLNRAAAIHYTSPAEAEAVSGLGLTAPTFVVPNAIKAARFTNQPQRGHLRQQVGVPDKAILLLFLGRLTRIKRPDIAVDVLAAAQALDSDVHLLVAGPDEDELSPQLIAQAHRLGCRDKLHLTGLLNEDQVVQALVDSDLLLMPTEVQENFGVSALEAMASGVTILVSEGIPVGYWAIRAGAGQVVPCRTQAFQQAALDLLANPSKLRAMGQAGRELANRQFDVSSIAQQMLANLEAIVTTGKPLVCRNNY